MLFGFFLQQMKRRNRRRSALVAVPALLETLEGRQLLTTPGMITGVGAEQTGPPEFDVTWAADENADHYEVEFTGDPIRFELTRTSQSTRLNINLGEFNQQSLFSNSYDIRVRGVGSEGELGEWSDTINFIFEGLPNDPAPPAFIDSTLALNNSYFVETAGSQISWNWNGYTPVYDVWINKIEAEGPVIHLRDTVNQSRFVADSAFEPGTYKFWARARHPERVDNYVSEWVGPLTTVIGNAQPEVTGPITTTSAQPEITWGDGADGVPFELWVNQEGGASKVIYETDLSGNSFTPSTDLADGTYSAWVRQTPATSGPLPWSSRFRFVVGGAGIPGTTSVNVTGETGNVNFSWNSAANATTYDLYVTRTTDGSRLYGSQSIDVLQFSETEITNSAVSYRAWLRAFNSDGVAGAWSNAVTFGIDSSGQVVVYG